MRGFRRMQPPARHRGGVRRHRRARVPAARAPSVLLVAFVFPIMVRGPGTQHVRLRLCAPGMVVIQKRILARRRTCAADHACWLWPAECASADWDWECASAGCDERCAIICTCWLALTESSVPRYSTCFTFLRHWSHTTLGPSGPGTDFSTFLLSL
ncbi:hypothetical protein DFH11DRAFT_1232630 [Phellopilus nigrolimitatus]|nr:hypothetical protein DFH11DRAFT_1287327 [Phellopilus nigrolimitatus]KAH8106639.1 hypothetical protein DFH11DRAFT_1232630 [Phellopilus nigrolimitatus]